MPTVRASLAAMGILGVLLLAATSAFAQQGAAGGEWRSYAGEAGGTKYSPLDQIHAGNVQDLYIAWRWRSVDHELADADPDLQFNPLLLATPLMVGGRLLMSTNLGQAAAIDPATGETTWATGRSRTARGGRAGERPAAWGTGTIRSATTSGSSS